MNQTPVPPWEQNKSNPSDLEEKLTEFWKKRKWWILAGIAISQLIILSWSFYQLSHPAIPPNEEGRVRYSGNQYPLAESKFIESASFGFRREKPLLNLGLNYSQIQDYEESHRIIENVMQSNRFFWEAYAADGHVLFEWGKKELDNPECDIRQTEILWTISKKRFRYASLIAFFQITSIHEGMELRKSYQEMGQFVDALPAWREACLNPPPQGGGDSDSDSDESSDGGGGGGENSDRGDGSPDKNDGSPKEGDGKPEKEQGKPDPGDDTPEKGDGKPDPKSDLEKKRQEQKEKRESKLEELDINPNEKGDLDEARKRMNQGANSQDYVRHKEEINLVTKPSELEKAMKNAEW
ncbi:MAG: hypothetical protein JJT78_03920 [Leptospira sp.]|nr:hypothetical protein [Leptospira sp.]